MAIVVDRETGTKIRIDPDVAKYYKEEIKAGLIDIPRSNKPIKAPGWASADRRGEPISRGQTPVDKDLGWLEGVSYELCVDGKRRRSGIILGFDKRSPDIAGIRVVALEDREVTSVKEVAYPLDLVLSNQRGSLSMRLQLNGLDGVFAKGRLIQATKN